MKKSTFLAALALGLVPLVASAQVNIGYFENIINGLGRLVNGAIPVLIGIGLLIFFWGLIQYIRKPEEGTGKKIMIAGLVGLFVMVSVWGLIRLAQGVFGVQSNAEAGQQIQSPRIPR